MFRSFDEMIDFVKKMEKKQVVAVVGADKPVAVEAAIDMVVENLAVPVLFGNEDKIKHLIEGTVLEGKVEIVPCADNVESCSKAADWAAEGKVQILKEKQDKQISRDAKPQDPFFRFDGGTLFQETSRRVSDNGGKKNQRQILIIPTAIKKIACEQKPGNPGFLRHHKIRCKHYGKEEKKLS